MGLGDLYAAQARSLFRHVRARVRAPDHVIEDACQFAWTQLLRRRPGLGPEAAYGWLLSTALREAYRLLELSCRDLSLEAELERSSSRRRELTGRALAASAAPDDMAVRHEHLAVLRSLPARQQRLLWLKALGLSQVEVSAHERCTLRTVNRQLARARHQLRNLADAA